MNFDKHRDLSSISSSKEKEKEEKKKTTSEERSRRNPHRRNIKISSNLSNDNFSKKKKTYKISDVVSNKTKKMS
jgi:hypothetical protein